MQSFTGTARLVRLALRRDRVKLPAWIIALTLMVASNIPAVISFYGKSMETQITYAATTAPSLVSRIFNGPINGPDIGEIVVNEVFLFAAIAAAFMSTLTVVRHTRQNEETGRAELIGSAVVGRYASLTAALIVAIGANLVLTALCTAALLVNDLPTGGSVGMAAALGATGITFAAVAAVTAQLAESARGANSFAAIGIGIAFLLRAAGDGLGTLTPDRLGILSAWPSWLSPIGWGQQLHPFTDKRWWVFGLYAAFFVATTLLAFYWNAIRDTGLGMIAARKGPATAPPSLLSVWGLTRHLQRGILRGWAIAIAIMGLTMGLVSKEFSKLLTENPDIQAYLQALGGMGNFEDVFFAGMLSLMGVCIAGYVIQALQRMRTEEAGAQLEPVLAAHVSRIRWAASHIGYAVVGTTILLLLLGLTMSTTYVLITDAPWSQVTRLTGAALVQLPAVLVLAGLATALFGLLPRATVAVSWSTFALCLLIAQFGQLLKLPQLLLNISPFTHLPAVPAQDIRIVPVAALLAIGIALAGIGLLSFRRRDLTTA